MSGEKRGKGTRAISLPFAADERTSVAGYVPASEVEDEWEELADRSNAPPWLRAGWLGVWARAFGAGPLEVVALRRDGRLAGLVPLVRRRGAVVSPTNWHTPDFRLVAEDPEARQQLAAALFGAAPRRVDFGFLTGGEGDIDDLRAAAERASYSLIVRELEQSPYVATAGAWDEYERTLDRHLVTETRRRRRRLDEEGEVAIEVADGRERLDDLLEEGFAVEAAGWKGAAGTAIRSSEDTRRFYVDLARWASERGWLRLAFLRLDGRALAFQYLVEHDDVLSQLKGGYDEAYRKFAPGTLLTYELLGRAFASGTRSYEFLGGDEAFKREWTDSVRTRLLFQAFAPTAAGRVDRSVYAYGRPVAKRLRGVLRR